MRLPRQIPTSKQLRQLESQYIKECGNNWGQVLMEIAGRSVAQVAHRVWEQTGGSVLVYCGRGNNGGDGLAAARYLHVLGVPVTIAIIPEKSGIKKKESDMSTPEASANYALALKLGIAVNAEQAPSIVIDALLGTGIDRDLEGVYKTAVGWVNQSGAFVIAVDLPSGINSDTGSEMGAAVRADHTVTFGYLKPGLLIEPGATFAGSLSLVDIGLPPLSEEKPYIEFILPDAARNLLPLRPSDSHKGTFGTVLTIAGSLGMTGASIFASQSALRVGAGLSLLATPKSLIAHLPAAEIIYRPLAETEEQSISQMALLELPKEIEKATAIILGPGISTNKDTVKFVQRFLKEILPTAGKPCVIDADALNAVAEDISVLTQWQGNKPIVLTPHPKELSRLLDKPVAEIQANRLDAAKKAADKFGCVVVLKGSHSIIATPDSKLFINPTGNAGMATAGSGDVLSGIIGGLLAQHLTPADAAAIGVYIHGLAGDLAAANIGNAGMIAPDIMLMIPSALANIKSDEPNMPDIQLL